MSMAATVAMASAVLFFGLLMLSGHAMDSNTDQSAAVTNLETLKTLGPGGATQRRLHSGAADQTSQPISIRE
jgi:hypothetical protein